MVGIGEVLRVHSNWNPAFSISSPGAGFRGGGDREAGPRDFRQYFFLLLCALVWRVIGQI